MRRCLIFLAVLALAPSLWASRPLVIKLGTVAPAGTLPHQALLEMAEVFRQESDGAVQLKIYAGVLGDEATLVRKLRIGQIQAAMLTSKGLALFTTEHMSAQLPMLFADSDEMDAVFAQMQPTYDRALDQKGLVSLGWVDGGWMYFFTTRPVLAPSDIRGLKMWMWPHDAAAAQSFAVLGFRPVVLTEIDILPSLQTGMVQAFPTTPVTALALQTYRHTPHMTQVRWGSMLVGVVVQKRVWQGLDAGIAKRIRERCSPILARLSSAVRHDSAQAIALMQSRGLHVHRPNAEQTQAWQRKAAQARSIVRGRSVDAALVDRVLKLRDRYRREKAQAARGEHSSLLP